MIKKILIVTCISMLALSGCDVGSTTEVKEKDALSFDMDNVEFYTGPDTNVEYLIFKFPDKTDYEVVPRYNPDGTLKTID